MEHTFDIERGEGALMNITYKGTRIGTLGNINNVPHLRLDPDSPVDINYRDLKELSGLSTFIGVAFNLNGSE